MSNDVFQDPELGVVDEGAEVKPPEYPVLGQPEAEEEKRREADFSRRTEWKGKPLVPSIGRYMDFLRVRTLLKYPPLNTVLRSQAAGGNLEAFIPDACLLVFLCLRKPEEMEVLPTDDAVRMRELLDAWVVENVDLMVPDEVLRMGFRCYNSFYENQHEPAPAGKGRADDEGN